MMNPITSVITYVKTSIAELKKVSWPTRETTIRYSILVMIVSLFVAVFFATLDFGFSKGMMFLVSQKQTEQAAEPLPATVPDLQPTDVQVEGGAVETTVTNEPEPGTIELNADDLKAGSDGIQLPANE